MCHSIEASKTFASICRKLTRCMQPLLGNPWREYKGLQIEIIFSLLLRYILTYFSVLICYSSNCLIWSLSPQNLWFPSNSQMHYIMMMMNQGKVWDCSIFTSNRGCMDQSFCVPNFNKLEISRNNGIYIHFLELDIIYKLCQECYLFVSF